ncbi:MAG: sodium/proline symporter PutP [Stackebrandtia sp.]
MVDINAPILTTFILYLVLMVLIGLWVYRRTRTFSDFALGGRSLSAPVAALSAQSSDMSGWLMLGLAGSVYAGGLGATWIAIGLLAGSYLSWLVVAPRLRTYTARASDAVSLSSYFEERFEDRGKVLPNVSLLRIVSAAVIVFFFTVYVASGLVAGGKLFDEVFGVPPATAMAVAVAVIVAYSFLGGFLAVSFTDVVQGTMMLLALLVLPFLAIVAIGGFGAFGDRVDARGEGLFNLGKAVTYESPTWTAEGAVGVVAVISLLAWGIGYFGQPHILARYMGIRSVRDVPVARRIATGWTALVLAGSCLVALAGVAYLEPLEDPEKVFIVMAQELTHPWVAGLLLAALLAAIMSTADSQLLVASTAITEDFYRALFNRQAGQTLLVWTGRGAVIAVGLAAYALALSWEDSVMGIVEYAWAGFGASFGPVIVLSLYWSRMTWAGALAGIVGGALTAGLWRYYAEDLGPLKELYEIIPGSIVALAAALIFGKFVGTPPQREWAGALDDEPEAPQPEPATA